MPPLVRGLRTASRGGRWRRGLPAWASTHIATQYPPQAHLGVVGRPGDVLHERATAAADLVDRRRQPLARHRASPSVLQREGDHGYGRAPGSGARDPDPVGVATALCEGLCGSLPEGVKSCHGVAASGEG